MREKGDRDAAVSREGAAAQLSSGRTAHAGGEAGAASRARVLVQELRERAQGPACPSASQTLSPATARQRHGWAGEKPSSKRESMVADMQPVTEDQTWP